MNILSAVFGGAALALASVSSAWAVQPLLTPTELNSLHQQADVRVIDIRPPDAYAAGHIPGAVSAPYAQWRGPANNPGQLRSVDEFTKQVQALGVDQDTHAIVVSSGADSTDFGASARVYWTLKYLGLTDLSILNGGEKAWVDAGLPQDKSVPAVTASTFQAHPDAAILATTDQVAAQVGNPSTTLVDARPLDFYLGKVKAPTAQVPGTIKGAVNVENGRWFKPGTSIFVAPDQARQIAAQLLPESKASETISFCNTGHWAATDWFALSEVVGVKNVRLYPESLAEWSHNADLPMENVPGRSQQILNKLKGIFS